MGEYRNTPNFKEFILLQRSYSVSSKLDSWKLTVKLLQYCWLNNVVILYSYHVWTILYILQLSWLNSILLKEQCCSLFGATSRKLLLPRANVLKWKHVAECIVLLEADLREDTCTMCVCVRGGGLLHLLFRVLRTVMEWPRTGGFNICRFNVNMYT